MSAEPQKLMNMHEVLCFFGGADTPLHHSTLYKGIKAGHFPKPVRIGPKLVRWLRSECEAVLAAAIAARDAGDESHLDEAGINAGTDTNANCVTE